MKKLLSVAALCGSLVFSSYVYSDFDDGIKYFDKGQYASAYEELLPYAKQGNAKAQRIVGDLKIFGFNGVPVDYSEGIDWLEKAAKQGDVDAMASLGTSYMYGFGVNRNEGVAENWLLRSAELGSVRGQGLLANLYASKGNAEFDKKAFKYFLMAAKQGEGVSQSKIAIMYLQGKAVNQDYEKSLYWALLSAENGNSDGQLIAGLIYSSGYGLDKPNVSEGKKWIQASANQGNEKALEVISSLP